jgi:ABC-type multidrug transport system ATPase subunit
MTRPPDAAPPAADAARVSMHRQPNPRGRAPSVAALLLDGIVKSWDSGGRPVLDGVRLTVGKGTTHLVTGRNGAGKTTLLRIAAGLLTPEQGTVRLNGLDSERNRREFQQRLGFLSAGNTGLYARLKVHHHVEFWSRLALVPRERRKPAIDRVLNAFELRPLVGRRVDRLSMGQRQRLRIALAFLHDPELVLLDEPTTSLDEDGVHLLERALTELKAQGGAAVMCAPSGEDLRLTFDSEHTVTEGRLESP